MHPAFSIIVFTTLSGLGYGLAAVLGFGVLDPAAASTRVAHVLALLLIGGGLASSTLHLGNPRRAWRAFSQWRTSWLSREGVMAVVSFGPLLVSAWASVIEGRYVPLAGLLGTACCAVTVYCTAMIYASLKSVDAWHTPLTPTCYLLFSAAGGTLIALVAALAAGGPAVPLAAASLVLMTLAWASKMAWWRRLRGLVPISTAESATGLGRIGRVRLLERPHTNDNYLTREMGYRVARKHALKLSRLAVALGGAAPGLAVIAAIAASGPAALLLQLAAVLLFGFGLAMERWLFFAEARHSVMNYYGS